MEVIAHRCRGFGEPDNSLAALEKALASKVDGVEIDVRQGNHCLILWHDAKYQGTKLIKVTPELAEQFTLATFDECCATFKKLGKGKTLHIDIKDRGMEQELIDTIRKYKIQKQVIIVSWNEKILETIHFIDKALPLSFSFRQGVFGKIPSTLQQTKLPITYVNIVFTRKPNYTLAKKIGRKVYFVNVDTPIGNQELKEMKVFGSMTNKPLSIV